MKYSRAVCPDCGKECAVRPPRGGDGSCDVFPRHLPPRGESRIGKNTERSYCVGSRQEVPATSYVPDPPPSCNGSSIHVFTLGASRCSMCGWDRYRRGR